MQTAKQFWDATSDDKKFEVFENFFSQVEFYSAKVPQLLKTLNDGSREFQSKLEKLQNEKEECEKRYRQLKDMENKGGSQATVKMDVDTKSSQGDGSSLLGAIFSGIGGFFGSSDTTVSSNTTSSSSPTVNTLVNNTGTQTLIDTVKAQSNGPASVLNQVTPPRQMGIVIPTQPKDQFGNNKAPYHLRHIEWDDGKSTDTAGYYDKINFENDELELDDWATAASLAHHRNNDPDWQKGGHPLERYYTKGNDRYEITVTQQGKPQAKQPDRSDKLIVTKNGHQFPAIVEMKGVQDIKTKKSLGVTGRAIYDRWATQDQQIGDDEALYYAKKGNNAVWLKRNAAGQWTQFQVGSQMTAVNPRARFGDRIGIADDNDYGYSARRRRRK